MPPPSDGLGEPVQPARAAAASTAASNEGIRSATRTSSPVTSGDTEKFPSRYAAEHGWLIGVPGSFYASTRSEQSFTKLQPSGYNAREVSIDA
jgi:hypothetical protein